MKVGFAAICMTKLEYVVSRVGFRPSGCTLPQGFVMRPPEVRDREHLAVLMLDSYQGTIDHGGEDLGDVLAEIDRYLAGEAYPAASRVAERGGVLHSALLMSLIAGLPVVGYVMTRAADKGRGFARALLDAAAAAAWEDGHDQLWAFITEGNRPSESIFVAAGFETIAAHDD